ncbi:DUF6591 domain-containing protein [Butyrivibrio sp. MC2013]|uniref:DUF6591 domain-containing protein n=1 Tax=Butyrivibrio sp. MC2013 TaxID=1280686 RepID=UPI000407F59A|nr:DUF6591 domain-containing protein [Butyrivibrio sp. MC2013]
MKRHYGQWSVVLCVVVLTSLLMVACGKATEDLTSKEEIQVEHTEESASFEEPGAEEVTTGEASAEENKEITDTDTDSSQFVIDLEGISSLDELEDRIEEHLSDCIESLSSRVEKLSAEIDSYDKYCKHSEEISDFYKTIEDDTRQMCIMLREYSAVYARMILDSDMSKEDKYDAIEGISDCIYDDACDEIKDEIYDELMDDMKKYFYDGVLEDGNDSADYSEWVNICSEEYSQWYDSSSEVYSLYSDAASDIYSFYSDMSSAIYSEDTERAEKKYSNFLKRIEKEKNKGKESDIYPDAKFDTSLRPAESYEDIEDVVDAHVSECVQALKNEWTDLSSKIDTYDKYVENTDDIEDYYEHVEDASVEMLNMISNYGVLYAKLVVDSDLSNKDKYLELDNFKYCIYEDACEYIKDDIYKDLLEDIKDYCYGGILGDIPEDVDYSDWSDARSDAYDWWSDARGGIYEEWSDTRSDLYSFWGDVRSELYSGDIDKAKKEITTFEGKIGGSKTINDTVNDEDVNSSDAEEHETSNTLESAASSDIRPEFKQAMDDYEDFYDEYIDFMKKYNENPTDTKLLGEYFDMLTELEEMNESFSEWEDDDLNDAELEYYLDVNARVEKKMLESL